MLDDCKGEKFDELLAVFSTAVLRKVLAVSSDDGPLNPAINLSTAKGLTPEQYQLVVPLVLAHRVSLGAMGERRARVRNTHEKFSELLDNKKAELASRSNASLPNPAEESVDFNTLLREVNTNWLGSQEWAETLLHGGSRTSHDTFLELPFAKAWSKANASSIEGLRADASQDLLADLESRVSRQQARLRRWRIFRDSIRRESSSVLAPASTGSNSPLEFSRHQTLTIASISKAVRQSIGGSSIGSSYLTENDELLLSSMNEALAQISGKPQTSAFPTSPHSRDAEVDKPAVLEDTNPLPSPRLEQKEPDRQTTSPPMETNQRASSPPEPNSRQSESPSVHISEPDPTPDPEPQPRTFTLAERTRKSMSLIPPSTKNPRGSIRSRKPRSSFPVNQFETPRKQSAQSSDAPSGRSTPRDQLFDDNADYASVFRSRPRVAHSPILSPAVHVSPVDEFDLGDDGDEGSQDDDYDFMNSPLAARPNR